MNTNTTEINTEITAKPRSKRRIACCGCCTLPPVVTVIGVYLLMQNIPLRYPGVNNPISAPPTQISNMPTHWLSPYLGHTGSWDGKGGGMRGSNKIADMDREIAMGLHWTFMPVYWRQMEPNGPTDPESTSTQPWNELDAFVIAAHDRGLNILMQAPVVGGNGGGPPTWAGVRDLGKSAPKNMAAVAEFAKKLAARYKPGGTLASSLGWGTEYGVRAWELDNEPANYLTNWSTQPGDYAEFVSKCAAAIKAVDPQAVVASPAVASGTAASGWLQNTLNPLGLQGSAAYHKSAIPYSIGPASDAVSFHVYEGLDTAFAHKDRTIETVFTEIRAVFEANENRAPQFAYARKQEYWHTEGNFDFIGVLSQDRRASWRFQFMTRAFAAGIRRVAVMDAASAEQAAEHAYTSILPDPFPMVRADSFATTIRGKAVVFQHNDRGTGQNGCVWILWAQADTGDAVVKIPLRYANAAIVDTRGNVRIVNATNKTITVSLNEDAKMAPGLIIVDRPQLPRPTALEGSNPR